MSDSLRSYRGWFYAAAAYNAIWAVAVTAFPLELTRAVRSPLHLTKGPPEGGPYDG